MSVSKDISRYMFFFQAEDGIRDLVRSRGLGDVYKRQNLTRLNNDLINLLSTSIRTAKENLKKSNSSTK